MMSRALGRGDMDTVYKSSAFGFYCALISGILFSLLYTVFSAPLLVVLGASEETAKATGEYLLWTVSFGAAPAILNVVMAYLVRAEGRGTARKHRHNERLLFEYHSRPDFHPAVGLNLGAAGAGCATFLSNCVACLYFFVLLFVRRGRTYCASARGSSAPRCALSAASAASACRPRSKPAQCDGYDGAEQLCGLFRFRRRRGDGHRAEDQHGAVPDRARHLAGHHAADQLQLRERQHAAHEKDIFLHRADLAHVPDSRDAWLPVLCRQSRAHVHAERGIVAYGTAFLRGMCLAMPFLCMDFLAVGVFQACGLERTRLSLLFCARSCWRSRRCFCSTGFFRCTASRMRSSWRRLF